MIRLFLGEALLALAPGRRLEVTIETEATFIRVRADGAAPPSLDLLRVQARRLGTDVEYFANRNREAAWLSLPRA
jgi:hypothetical protein